MEYRCVSESQGSILGCLIEERDGCKGSKKKTTHLKAHIPRRPHIRRSPVDSIMRMSPLQCVFAKRVQVVEGKWETGVGPPDEGVLTLDAKGQPEEAANGEAKWKDSHSLFASNRVAPVCHGSTTWALQSHRGLGPDARWPVVCSF